MKRSDFSDEVWLKFERKHELAKEIVKKQGQFEEFQSTDDDSELSQRTGFVKSVVKANAKNSQSGGQSSTSQRRYKGNLVLLFLKAALRHLIKNKVKYSVGSLTAILLGVAIFLLKRKRVAV